MDIKQPLFYCEILYHSLGSDKNFHEDSCYIFYFGEKGFEHFQSKIEENKLYGEYIETNDILKKWCESLKHVGSLKKFSVGSGITILEVAHMIGQRTSVFANDSDRKIFDKFLDNKLNQLKEMVGEHNLTTLYISSEELNKIVKESENKKTLDDRNEYILEYLDIISLTNKLQIDLPSHNKVDIKNKI